MKKNIMFIILSGLFLISCSKQSSKEQLPVEKNITASSTISETKQSMELIKAENAERIIPQEWKSKLSENGSKYSIGKMDNDTGVWLCLIHFSDDLKQSNVEDCKQISNIPKTNSSDIIIKGE